MLYDFELGYNVTEVMKNICVKGEGTIDHSTITRGFKKFCSACKDLKTKTKLSRPKTMFSEAFLQAVKSNPANSAHRVLSVVHDLCKKICSC